MFPSHIGSRSTFDPIPGIPMYLHVSIPHWFSLNENDTHKFSVHQRFPSHIGSRSTQYIGIELNEEYMFPSHIGSRSTVYSLTCGHTSQRFHPTLVLAQRLAYLAEKIRFCWFPSHIGSRSTQGGELDENGNIIVSIPHWFSLNLLMAVSQTLRTFPSHIGSRST